MNTEFSRILASEMKHYSESREVDAISRVHGQIDELKDIMVKNIGEYGMFLASLCHQFYLTLFYPMMDLYELKLEILLVQLLRPSRSKSHNLVQET